MRTYFSCGSAVKTHDYPKPKEVATMNHLKTPCLLLCIVLTLAACDSRSRSGSVYVDASGPPIPQLEDFHIVDSYGNSTEDNANTETVLNPDLDQGIFEIYWRATSFYDYWVTVAINDRPSMRGSYILSTERCGPDFSCDYDGLQVCTYDADDTMGCGADLTEAENNQVGIEDLLFEIPEYLYLILEVCSADGFDCEFISREVSVY